MGDAISTENSIAHSSSFVGDASGLKQLAICTPDGAIEISQAILVKGNADKSESTRTVYLREIG